MKTTLVTISFLFFFNIANAQNLSYDYWLPLKRIEQINRLKVDKCDSLNEFPFKRIKFLSNQEISLFGYEAPDPDVCKIVWQKGTKTWTAQNEILNTLAQYSKIYRNSTIILKVENKILYVTLINKKDTITQKFVREYKGVNFIGPREAQVGNLLISGKFIESGSRDTIQFFNNGTIKYSANKNGNNVIFASLKFIIYNKECESYVPQRIIELTTSKGVKERYFIKSTNSGFDFYTIKSMKNPGTVGEIELSFSIVRVE